MNKNKNLLILISVVVMLFLLILIGSRMYDSHYKVMKATDVSSTKSSNGTTQVAEPDKASPQNTQSQSAAPSKPQQIYCGIVDMPEGVCVVIESIEQKGLVNNPNITFDTAELPSTAKVSINRNSWKKTSDSLSQISFNLEVPGRQVSGLLYFQFVDGNWKATGYTIS